MSPRLAFVIGTTPNRSRPISKKSSENENRSTRHEVDFVIGEGHIMHIRQSPHRPQALRSLQLLRTYSAPSLNWVGALRICEGYAQPRGGATETGSRGPSAR